MRLSVEAYSQDIPRIIRQLFEIVAWDQWRRRIRELEAREQQIPELAEYFDDKYPIERALGRARAFHKRFGHYPHLTDTTGPQLYELYAFASMLTRVHARLSPAGKSRLAGVLKSGLKTEPGLAPVALEMSSAAHFLRAGYDVDFADLEGREQFDILASKEGLELEVDCKTVSGDVGRAIPRRLALELFHRIRTALRRLDNQLTGGRAIRLMIPDVLTGNESTMEKLAALVIEAIQAGESRSVAGLADVSVAAFQPDDAWMGRAPTNDELVATAKRVLGDPNLHGMSLYHPNRGAAVIMAIESRKPDRVLRQIYKPLRDSAERQFGKNRPALLTVRLTDLSADDLRGLSSGQYGLARIAHRLFRGERRQHLFGVAYVAPGSAPISSRTPDLAGVHVQDHGTSLLFHHPEHPLRHDPRLALFTDADC